MKATGIKATLSSEIAKNSPSIENAKYGNVKMATKKAEYSSASSACIANGTVSSRLSSLIKK
jgi:hypothetical protein